MLRHLFAASLVASLCVSPTASQIVQYGDLSSTSPVVTLSESFPTTSSASAARHSSSGWKKSRGGGDRSFSVRPFDIGISLRGIYSLPFGRYYDGFSSGIGFEGDFKVCVSRDISLLFLFSRSGTRAADDASFVASVNYPYILLDEKYTFHVNRYYFGLQQTGPVNRDDRFPDMWYAWFAVGAVAHNLSGRVTVQDRTDNQVYLGVLPPTSDTRFGQAIGLGYVWRLNEMVGFDLSGSFEGIWTKRYTSAGTQTVGLNAFSLDFKAGVTFLLGAKPN